MGFVTNYKVLTTTYDLKLIWTFSSHSLRESLIDAAEDRSGAWFIPTAEVAPRWEAFPALFSVEPWMTPRLS